MDVGNAIATAVDLSISAAAFGGLALMTIQALRVTKVIPASALDAQVSLPVWKAVAAAAVVAYVGGYACDVIDAEEGWEDEDSGNEDEDDFDSDGESEEGIVSVSRHYTLSTSRFWLNRLRLSVRSRC